MSTPTVRLFIKPEQLPKEMQAVILAGSTDITVMYTNKTAEVGADTFSIIAREE